MSRYVLMLMNLSFTIHSFFGSLLIRNRLLCVCKFLLHKDMSCFPDLYDCLFFIYLFFICPLFRLNSTAVRWCLTRRNVFLEVLLLPDSGMYKGVYLYKAILSKYGNCLDKTYPAC